MARPVFITANTMGGSNAVQLDHHINPFQVGFGAVVTGTINYTIQHTFDDVQTVVSPTWFDNYAVAAQTTSQNGNYAYPINAVRVLVNSVSGGSVTVTFIQSGIHS